MTAFSWQALILAAGRGAQDPLVKATGVTHKCLLSVGGQPMLARVVASLRQAGCISGIAVAVENPAVLEQALQSGARGITYVPSASSAPASVIKAADQLQTYPLLVTTGDHPLLTAQMISHFCRQAEAAPADVSVGLATAETILAVYPQSIRTFFRFGSERVSGCNLFAISNPKGLALVNRWQYLDQLRKRPWRLVLAFGAGALLRFATGRLSLAQAFNIASLRLGITIKPVLMPFAEAAIDVDKPSDLDLANKILDQLKQGTQRE